MKKIKLSQQEKNNDAIEFKKLRSQEKSAVTFDTYLKKRKELKADR